VGDTVAGFLKAAEAQGVEGDLFNLGTGTDVTIQEIIDTVFKITGVQLPIVQQEVRMRPDKSEVTRLLSDNEKARQRLGWTPTIGLEAGLRRTVAWIEEHYGNLSAGRISEVKAES
jgi:nucleoside-diphosphate-sugar epimerase